MKASTPDQYIEMLPEERKDVIRKLRETIRKNLPAGFEEEISYGMIGYVVPKTIYSEGYHANPEVPLPFIHIASQKNHIAIYHMGMYGQKALLNWFLHEYSKYSQTKLDMGKSCLRFKKEKDIPFELIGQLAAKMTPEEWVAVYENTLKH
jgi:uncharacterized protein YdhG (YjbR/CyaY superfamily)